MAPGVRIRLFDRWLAGTPPNVPAFVYHRGELARDRRTDPALDELAEHVLRASDVRADVVSSCGHVRGEIVGSGQVRLFTRMDRGERVYVAVKARSSAEPRPDPQPVG